MQIFVEMWTEVPRRDGDKDGICVRERCATRKDAQIRLYHYLYKGFYRSNSQHSPAVYPQIACEEWLYPDWLFPKGLILDNDLGGHTHLCIREYSDATKITEGVFRL